MDLVKRQLRGIASSVRLLILTTAGEDPLILMGGHREYQERTEYS